MTTIVTAAIWAFALLVMGALLVSQFGKPIRSLIEIHRNEAEASNQLKLAKAAERQNAAELDRATLAERAEERRAVLRQQAAEAEAAAAIACGTVEAQIEEQKLVIAARAEGRALVAKDRALSSSDEDGAESIKALMKAYTDYRKDGGAYALDGWMGGLELTGNRLTRNNNA